MNISEFRILLTLTACCYCASAYSESESLTKKDQGKDIEIVEVIGTKQSRYVVKESSALTGFNLDFLELPRVVNIIPEQLILDQKVTDLVEALSNTPGVTQQDGFGGTNDDFLIRGFRRNAIYRDGFRRSSNFRTNLSNVEYTQVVRGPGAITYGQVEPGGLVDIITKQPLTEQRIAGEARWGSHSDRFALIDWSQPINDKAAIRLVGSIQDAESFRDFTEINRDTLALSGRYDLSSDSQLRFSYEYRDESRPLDRGTITIPTPEGRVVINELLDIPNSRRFGEAFETFDTSFNFFDITLDHQLSADWQLKVTAAYEESSSRNLQARPLAVAIFDADGPITDDGRLIFQSPAQIPAILGQVLRAVYDAPTDRIFLSRRTDGAQNSDVEGKYVSAIAVGEIDMAGINHKISVGGSYRNVESSEVFISSAAANDIPALFGITVPLFNVQQPIYGNLPTDIDISLFPKRRSDSEEYGFFINDYMALTDKLGILVGGRVDKVENGGNTDESTSFTEDAKSEFSPQVAASYKLSKNSAIFVSYSEAFRPNTVVNSDLTDVVEFDPEDSNQLELGLKAEFFEGKLQTSVTAYDIEKTNVLVSDNGQPVLLDGQTSQGVELSVSGQPIEGMNVIAGYAYTDAEIGGLEPRAGNKPSNVAENTFNLWASYEFQAGRLQGLGIGGGYQFVDDRFGNIDNSFTLDSYGKVDLSLWYTLSAPGFGADDTIRLQLAVKNLFEQEYYAASGGDLRITHGAPRTVFGSVSFAF